MGMATDHLGFHCHRLEQIELRIEGNGLRRGEFYNFPAHDVALLRKEVHGRSLASSIHAPLVKPEWYPDPPTWSFLCDVDPDSRNRTFRMIEETLAHAKELGAEYVIVHFPTPSTDGDGERPEKLESIAWRSCERLAEMAGKRKVPIHIEALVNSPYLTTGFLPEALGQYPLGYCFDTGHMNLAAHRNGFDLYEFVREMAPFVTSMHLWNTRGADDYAAYRHIAVHPSQDPKAGWTDIPRLLEILAPSYPIIFENPAAYPELLGDYDYQDGVRWVRDILETLS